MEVVQARKCHGVVPANPPDVTIDNLTIQNSKTNFGTTVVCQAAVIKQFVKFGDDVEPSDIKALKDALVNDETKKFSWRTLINVKSLLLTIFLAVLVAGSTVLALKLIKSAEENDVMSNDDEDYTPPMNFSLRFEPRAMWAANELNSTQSSNLSIHPARFVIIDHTAGPECFKEYTCQNIVKGIQQYHISLKLNDIRYNFLIGGDGNIYEGRGWGKAGAASFGFNCDSVSVAFIGDFDRVRVQQKSIDAFNLLVEEGVTRAEIESEYKLFSQYQISGKPSPGRHLINTMKNWAHKASFTKDDLLCD